MILRILSLLAAAAMAVSAQQAVKSEPIPKNDVLLRAMRDELNRSKALRVTGAAAPYFIQYRVQDGEALEIEATLDGLLSMSRSPIRVQEVDVRVGSYDFDNTNYVLSGYYSGSRYDSNMMPLGDDYLALRHSLWLATDREYKTALEAIGRKRSALRNVNMPDRLPDFSKAAAVEYIGPRQLLHADDNVWKQRVLAWSNVFAGYPKVLGSGVEFQAIPSTSYLVNTEGTVIRKPDGVAFVRIRASGQAADGMPVRDAAVVQSSDLNGLPPDQEIRQVAEQVAGDVTQLSQSPQGDEYTGPVLFDAGAAAQLFGQLLGDNLKIARKPVPQPGRPVPYLPSELEGRLGSKVLPEWMDVVDDPSQTAFDGQPLFGHYEYDDEGVAAQPLTLIGKGVLQAFLLTRTPAMREFSASNGHGRMHGSFGAYAPGFGNLFVRASQTEPYADLKKKLIALCAERHKPFGYIVRKLDFPSSATVSELRRMMTAMAQSGGGARPVAPPILLYRVYPDGHEELVRGLRFRGLSTRAFRDILAASKETAVFNFLDSRTPFALMGAGGYVTNASVISPAVLFDEVELEKTEDELPKPPIVPPPPLSASR